MLKLFAHTSSEHCSTSFDIIQQTDMSRIVIECIAVLISVRSTSKDEQLHFTLTTK